MIQLDDVRVITGPLSVFGPISLTIKPGKWLGIIGPAGAGKSLLGRLIAGLQKPDDGRRLIALPADAQRQLLAEGRGLRFVPGDEPFDLSLCPKDILTTRAALRGYVGKERRQLVQQSIERWFLEPIWERPLHELSRSVRRRVAVADAFFGSPRVVVLDDPFWGCDDLQIRNIREGIGHYTTGTPPISLVMTTRSRKEMVGLVDEVVELAPGGHVKFTGAIKAWLNRRADAGVYRLVARGPGGKIEELVKRVNGVFDVMWHEGGEYNTFEVRAETTPKVREMIFRVMAVKNFPIVELAREENPFAEAAAAEAAAKASISQALKPKSKTKGDSARTPVTTTPAAAQTPPVPEAAVAATAATAMPPIPPTLGAVKDAPPIPATPPVPVPPPPAAAAPVAAQAPPVAAPAPAATPEVPAVTPEVPAATPEVPAVTPEVSAAPPAAAAVFAPPLTTVAPAPLASAPEPPAALGAPLRPAVSAPEEPAVVPAVEPPTPAAEPVALPPTPEPVAALAAEPVTPPQPISEPPPAAPATLVPEPVPAPPPAEPAAVAAAAVAAPNAVADDGNDEDEDDDEEIEDFAPAGGGGRDFGDAEEADEDDDTGDDDEEVEEIEDFNVVDAVESDTKIYDMADLELLKALIAEGPDDEGAGNSNGTNGSIIAGDSDIEDTGLTFDYDRPGESAN